MLVRRSCKLDYPSQKCFKIYGEISFNFISAAASNPNMFMLYLNELFSMSVMELLKLYDFFLQNRETEVTR